MFSSVPMMCGVRGIGCRDRLGAGGLERHGERVRAGVCCGEGIVGWQDGLRVRARELDRAQVASVGAAIRAERRDGERLRTSPRRAPSGCR